MGAFASVHFRGAWPLLLLGFVHCGVRSPINCSIPGGLYVEHLAPADTLCSALADRVVTIDGYGGIADDAFDQLGISRHCEGDVDPAACDAVLICEEVAADFRTVFTTGLTIRTGAISGTVTIDSTDPGRAPHCAYDVTLTPM